MRHRKIIIKELTIVSIIILTPWILTYTYSLASKFLPVDNFDFQFDHTRIPFALQFSFVTLCLPYLLIKSVVYFCRNRLNKLDEGLKKNIIKEALLVSAIVVTPELAMVCYYLYALWKPLTEFDMQLAYLNLHYMPGTVFAVFCVPYLVIKIIIVGSRKRRMKKVYQSGY